MLRFQTILAPTDFCQHSQPSFQLAVGLARDHAARLVVLHVATPPPFITPGELQRALQGPDGYRAALEVRLRQTHAADLAAGVAYRIEDGDPAAEILRVAREIGCDLIVMGTHGRTGLGRLLLGSVAERVLREAPCPVVTVKVPPASSLSPRASVPEQAGKTS